VGRRFDAAFAAGLSEVYGGPRGCSHLLTLFHLLASALPRALDLEQALGAPARAPGERFFRRSVFVDGHEPAEGALALAVQLSDFHSMPAAGARERLDHFARQDEVRVLAAFDLAKVSIQELSACERSRTRETLAGAPWQERSAALAAFVGRPVMPGLGKALRAALGGEPEAALLLDALLQLAPGFVQCTPALVDSLVGRLGGRLALAEGRRALPDFLATGGAADSCYMWRRGGPLVPAQEEGPSPSRKTK
jgi:hypothetical protein